MDYKKYVKSRSTREKILQMFSFIPDVPMVRFQYWVKTGNKLNLKNPKRFTEKLQWYKLYYKNPYMVQCVDKYDVREYVASKGLEKYLVPCYGVYDSVDDIDWEKLPKQFVMKDTLGGGGNSVIVVKNKDSCNIEELVEKGKKWTGINAHKRGGGREWPYYSGKKHRIIIEKYINSETISGGLIDYKFFCFNGKAIYLYIISDRNLGNNSELGVFDINFKKIKAKRTDEEPLKREILRPDNFEEMKNVAQCLAGNFPEVRVDMYNVDGTILFGEVTFFDGSGYMKFEPDSFDFEMGEKFILPEKLRGGYIDS